MPNHVIMAVVALHGNPQAVISMLIRRKEDRVGLLGNIKENLLNTRCLHLVRSNG